MIKQAFLKFVQEAAPEIQSWPRRKPGQLLIGDHFVKYGDLHGLFWQAVQIFQQDLYGTTFKTDTPVILDCGAHVGMAALYFKSVYPNAKVTSYEADPLLAEMAKANLAAFGFDDVDVQAAAVWTHSDGVHFDMSGDDAGHVMESQAGTATPSIDLKSRLEAEPVDLVKLDVEGAEFPLIEHCADSLDRVQRMIIEVHHLGGAPPRVGDLISTLENAGFRVAFQDLNLATWATPLERPPFSCLPTDRYVVTVYAWR